MDKAGGFASHGFPQDRMQHKTKKERKRMAAAISCIYLRTGSTTSVRSTEPSVSNQIVIINPEYLANIPIDYRTLLKPISKRLPMRATVIVASYKFVVHRKPSKRSRGISRHKENRSKPCNQMHAVYRRMHEL
jgi:hypothetical protein